MSGFRYVVLLMAGVTMAGCTSDPNAPVNQTPPIRQMDRFFDSMTAPPDPAYRAAPDYSHMPGYAPAYPPY